MKIHILQHVSFEPAGMITDWAKLHQHSLSYSFLFEKEICWPARNDMDMLVMMGGPMGVNEEDKFEWLKEEKRFIKDVIAADKIVLGICLGSQLLAEALGARVYPDKEKEIGFSLSLKQQSEKRTKCLLLFLKAGMFFTGTAIRLICQKVLHIYLLQRLVNSRYFVKGSVQVFNFIRRWIQLYYNQ